MITADNTGYLKIAYSHQHSVKEERKKVKNRYINTIVELKLKRKKEQKFKIGGGERERKRKERREEGKKERLTE